MLNTPAPSMSAATPSLAESSSEPETPEGAATTTPPPNSASSSESSDSSAAPVVVHDVWAWKRKATLYQAKMDEHRVDQARLVAEIFPG